MVAIYTDLRERIIPNKLTLPLIGIGIVFYLLLGLYNWNFWSAISGAAGAAAAFAIGYAMWLTGGWAGGDVKLYTALGALLPTYAAPYVQAPYPFLLTLLFNSVISILPILLIYAVVCRALGRGVFYEHVRITELKEGTIPAEAIYETNGKIERRSLRFWTRPKWDRIYADPRRAAGLARYQVGALKRLVRDGKLKNEIKIKKGMPFAPALGLGLIIAVFYGDLYWRFVLAFIGA